MTNLILLDPTIIESDEPRPPILWGHENQFQFQDLKDSLIDDAVAFFKREYFRRDILTKTSNFRNDKTAIEEYLNFVRFIMQDQCSIVCIDKSINKIAGIAVLRIMTNENYSWQFWRLMKFRNRLNEKIRNLCYDLFRYSTINGNYDDSSILHLFNVIVGIKYKGILRKESLILKSYNIARSIGIPTMTFIALSKNDQERARRCGLTCVNKIHYVSYLTNSRTQIFSNPGYGQYSVLLFVTSVGSKHFMSLSN